MKELKEAFHEMRNEWKGREVEFDRLLKQLNDANSPEKAFEVRQKIMGEQQAQGRANTPPTMKHAHVEPSIGQEHIGDNACALSLSPNSSAERGFKLAVMSNSDVTGWSKKKTNNYQYKENKMFIPKDRIDRSIKQPSGDLSFLPNTKVSKAALANKSYPPNKRKLYENRVSDIQR